MYLKPFVAVIIGLTATSVASAANYRVDNQVWGYYNMDGTVSGSLLGSQPFNINRQLDGAYDYTSGNTAGSVPVAAAFNRIFTGDATLGAGDINKSAYAQTDWGFNHAGVKTDGFSKVDKTVVAYPQILGTSDLSNPITINTSTNTYSYATSRWEELYQISGGAGTGTAHIAMQVDGFLDGTSINNDNAQIYYSLSTFNGTQILGLSANTYNNTYTDNVYDPVTDTYNSVVVSSQSWSEQIFQNGIWSYLSGTGALNIEKLTLQGDYTFTYGDPLYLNSYLQTSVYGNGESNFINTVTMESFVLPENAAVYALSGANPAAYNIAFSGNGVGTVCGTLDCVNNGGNGGGGPAAVPVPTSIWLFGSALVGLLGVNRRQLRKN